MKVSDVPVVGQAFENMAENNNISPSDDVRSRFSDYLQAFDVAGKNRIREDRAEKTAGFDAAGWMLRVRELGLYEKARQDLMAEENLKPADMEAMSEDERIVFESRVYERVRHELVLRMKHHHCCECDEEEVRLYRYAPFLRT